MLPNFFLVGANKAGTTSLAHYLAAHPQVFMSAVKEPSYFALQGPPTEGTRYERMLVWDRDRYEELFDGVTDEVAVGEASTAYLISATASNGIHEEIPDARIIVVLRDPSDRAFSQFNMHLTRGLEDIPDFETVIDAVMTGRERRNYLRLGRYADDVHRYVSLFGPDQCHIMLYDDLSNEPASAVRGIYDFLGVDTGFAPNLSNRLNITAAPKSRAVLKVTRGKSRLTSVKWMVPTRMRSAIKKRAIAWNRTRPQAMSSETRRRLVEYYSDDIQRTERLIGRDLSAWRTV